mmetsp:Transcript_70643/g.169290  ORF Transcript_70643/g.169290 Transcript_70643/m.169290 type:complete len:539 (-) Transcript_70643:215-1831(-)|eukprot:CAMPEP_0178391458 /NCGR_PEP_ID=MMETSP0689_2-20121128/11174_1 /TAXON_ID=160604 /ORGANISM="Amphidinium massartii, Strain CS-259" /LENGTH=538 /DNA_ID=CAMNT_0020012003 /DNA_START=77 /DNA_END=1693 /DNA_ORIENTATION=+
MINYSTGTWGLAFMLQLRGSVFPKAVVWALPAAICAIFWNVYLRRSQGDSTFDDNNGSFAITMLNSYNTVLAFLLVFRSQLAYSRWWEGGALLQQLRGEWFNAYSSLLAFCTVAEEKKDHVDAFQQTLVKLMSMLYGFALQQVSSMSNKDFEIFDTDGLDPQSLEFLRGSSDRCEIVLQWIQRHVVINSTNGVLPIAPPILSRVFQEYSRGIVNLNNARKIKEFPFPFPWPQMITALLIIQFIVTPLLAGMGIKSWQLAASVTFLSTFASFGIHYIAQELENPYGDDANDLPLREMQRDMNRSLRRLLEPEAMLPPRFSGDPDLRVSLDRLITTGSIAGELSNKGPFCSEDSGESQWVAAVNHVASRVSRVSRKVSRASMPGSPMKPKQSRESADAHARSEGDGSAQASPPHGPKRISFELDGSDQNCQPGNTPEQRTRPQPAGQNHSRHAAVGRQGNGHDVVKGKLPAVASATAAQDRTLTDAVSPSNSDVNIVVLDEWRGAPSYVAVQDPEPRAVPLSATRQDLNTVANQGLVLYF